MADELEKSILEYLRSTSPTGIRADRLAARTELQAYVGVDDIHIARRSALPSSDAADFALLVQRIATIPQPDLKGEPCYSIAIVQFTLLGADKFSRNPVALTVQRLANQELRIMFSAYQGGMGTNGTVYDSRIERSQYRAARFPIDASDGWSFAYTLDVRFFYEQQAVDYV